MKYEDAIANDRTSAEGPLANNPVKPQDIQDTKSTTAVGSKQITRRSFMKTAGMLLAGSTLAACSSPVLKGPGPHGSNAIQLVYQDWRTEWFPGMAQQMLEEFRALQPNIHVFYTPDPEKLDQQMLADFQAGTAPDVFAGCCDFLPAWAQKGYLLDLRPYIEADLDKATIDEWDPAQVQALTLPDGIQFALPKYHGALGLFYNKNIFDQYHVDYPDGSWTHDDYRLAMRKLSHDRNQDGKIDLWGSMLDISWDRIQVHVNGWGGHFVDPDDPTKSMLADEEALQAMQWIRDRMWKEQLMASSLDVQNLETRYAFAEGRLAMVEDGSWSLKDILEGANFRLGLTSFPAGPKQKVTLATTDGFAIYAGTKYPEAAWELLKFLTSQKYGQAMARTHFLQPARGSLVEDWVKYIRQEYPQKTQDLDIGAFAEGHLQGYSVTAEIFANMSAARQLAKAAWDQIYTLGQSPVDLMKEISTQIESLQEAL
jgi:multiple sugar transport system substrate-binding protein